MRLSSVKVTNAQGSELEFPLEDPSGGFIVRDIQGLGPVKATLVSSSFANMDGGQYHSSRRETRNIVLTLGLEPDYAVSDVHTLREQLYSFFMPKTEGTLDFHLFDKFTENLLEQTRDVTIDAHIETCEPSIFTKDPAVDVSMICYDPDFVDLNQHDIIEATVSDLTETLFAYSGSVDTGVIFRLETDRDLSDFTIYHRPPDGSLVTIDFSYPLLAGDVVEISSVQGSKYVRLNRGGVESSILYAISPQSGWLRLYPGDNHIRVYTGLGTAVPYTFSYTDKYGGL